jgi:hypothetical protein
VKAWRKDNNNRPAGLRRSRLRTLYIQSSSARCTITPSAKHVKNLGSLIWRLGQATTVLAWIRPSEQYRCLREKFEASGGSSMSTEALSSNDYHPKYRIIYGANIYTNVMCCICGQVSLCPARKASVPGTNGIVCRLIQPRQMIWTFIAV